MIESAPDVLTIKDTAKLLAVSEGTIRNLIKSKELMAMRVGGTIRIPKNKLIEYMEHAISCA